MRIYVGNLPWSVDNDSLKDLFSSYGDVADAVVIRDRETGRSRGFGFVDLSDDEAGNAAIEAMHGTEIEGRDLVVVSWAHDLAIIARVHRAIGVAELMQEHGRALVRDAIVVDGVAEVALAPVE